MQPGYLLKFPHPQSRKKQRNTTDRIKPVICSSAEYVTTGSESQNREQIKVEASNSPASDAPQLKRHQAAAGVWANTSVQTKQAADGM